MKESRCKQRDHKQLILPIRKSYSHRRHVHSYNRGQDGVNDQALLRLAVKQSSSLAMPHQISYQEHEMLRGWPAMVAAQRAGAKMGVANGWVNTTRAQISSCQAVKEHF